MSAALYPSTQPRDFNKNEDPVDLQKLLFIVKKSLLWIALLLISGMVAAYIVVRYTKPLYESSTIIKLNFKNEATTLGLVENARFPSELNDISGEIEIIKSKLFLGRLVDILDYDLSVHYYGRYLTDERYGNSPIAISYRLKDQWFYDRPIDLTILNEHEYLLEYDGFTKKYTFNQEINEPQYNLLVERTSDFTNTSIGKYYIVFHSRDALINYFESALKVQPENFNAKTIKLSLTDFNKLKARDFINSAAKLYLTYTTEVKNQALEQKLAFLDNYIKETEREIKNYESYFENFTIENRTVSLDQDLNKTITLLDVLDSQRYNLQVQIGNFNLLKKQIQEQDIWTPNPVVLESMPKYLSEAIEEYKKALEDKNLKLNTYNEKTTVIARMDSQLDKKQKELLDILELYGEALEERMAGIRKRQVALENNFVELPAMGMEYNKNRQQYQLRENFLLSLIQSKMDMEITRAGTVTDAVILSPGSLPSGPIKPQAMVIYGAAFLLSTVFSFLFIAFRYLLHNKITTLAELEKLVDAPILGVVPAYQKEKLEVTKLVIDGQSKSAISEALRTLRTNMEFVNPGKRIHVISITSTVSGEGKTFIAANFGAVLSSTGTKVCIVDMDMRKPKVHQAFGKEPSPKGLSTILIGKATISESVRHTSLENLYYIPAGPTPPNPSELILTEAFNTFLAEIKEIFQVIILDTPPVGLVTDGVLAMKKSDIQLYVVKSEYSRRIYTKTIRDMQRTNAFEHLTIILNGVKYSSSGRSWYGNYGYGYGYGYYEDQENGV